MKKNQKKGYTMWLQSLFTIMVITVACSSEEPQIEQQSSQPEASSQTTVQDNQTLPDFFPEQIPLPEDYIIVRNSSDVWDEIGQSVEMNIALPGTIEEWKETYHDVLMREFEDVTFEESSFTGLQWRFHGHGFTSGLLALNENEGHLDLGSTDSSHLPVMLSLKMDEN